ncbi:DEHA2E10670p [Debaryomyces hansenii CBS767]|uniref:DEHA2E10670p n=1 Tax=Debaryomyces hansenii (strain ATCC 36239 / CBS 767 / BCRC 21394 / JCM 1990 / NBRC 0083 / IGC 2968) TaxID=284592 RepID=Q6BPU9_DEBHA|nr:DEHA2E10670p [Debaryomyces hansenii CBS767]CAG88010.2 DEHA2E10670p [Debaryomyces hansenii CBS767]|eukprot:XP_459771.2 DEHA2E10670p [Debaryomyces hansenii CBS767]
MDIDEPFNPDYYQHLLSSLTLNSRTLITELTTIAEKSTDQASEIVDIIEERIKKCLPQYKLFTVYLLDSICKNIGNPYNLLFGSRLYKIFTETYLVVTDTPTRQNLINLFKTWSNGRTNSGLELFPAKVIQKIEQFIIRATSISQTNQPSLPLKLTPDMLLREGNCLLQYIIVLNGELEKFPQTNEKVKEFLDANNRIRNNVISVINNVSDSILSNSKQEFENNVTSYHTDLQGARKVMDDQSFQQKQFLGSNTFKEDTSQIKIEIDLTPNLKFFHFNTPISEDPDLLEYVNDWGKPIVERISQIPKPEVARPVKAPFNNLQEEPKSSSSTPEPLTNSLGLNLGSVNFMDSFLGSPKNEISKSPINEINENPVDSYDPEHSIVDEDWIHPPTSHPNLKRKNSIDKPVIKKVRFDI